MKLNCYLAVALMLCTVSVSAETDLEHELRELKDTVQRSLQRIEELEQRLQEEQAAAEAPSPKTSPVTTAKPAADAPSPDKAQTPPELAPVQAPGSGKGFLELRQGDTTLSVGGRVRLDVTHNRPSIGKTGGHNHPDVGLNPAFISIDDSGEDKQLTFSIRNSWLWFKTRTPTEYGNLKTLLEFDLIGSHGSERFVNDHNPRIRHAYAEFADFTMGQTNTTFADVRSYPEIFVLPVNLAFVRQPMIRWNHRRGDYDLAVALESPETTLTDSTGARVAPDDDRLPDFVARAIRRGDWGHLSVAGMLRELRSDGAVAAGVSDAATGGALHLSGRIKTRGRDNLRLGLIYGNTVGRYTSSNTFNGGSIDEHGQISLHTMYTAHLAYQHWWTPKWRSSLVYGLVEADNDLDIVPSTISKRTDSLHLNLIWSPLKSASLGLEYTYATRELESGLKGDLNRIQFAATYNF